MPPKHRQKPPKARSQKRTKKSRSIPTLIVNHDGESPDPNRGFIYRPAEREWFDAWIRPIYEPLYDYAIKVHCYETRDDYVGYRYCIQLDPPDGMTREELEKRELRIHWPKCAWKPILGPRSNIESPSILEAIPIPESKPFPPEPLPGSVADQRLQAIRPETTAAERIAEKKRLFQERAARKKRYYQNF